MSGWLRGDGGARRRSDRRCRPGLEQVEERLLLSVVPNVAGQPSGTRLRQPDRQATAITADDGDPATLGNQVDFAVKTVAGGRAMATSADVRRVGERYARLALGRDSRKVGMAYVRAAVRGDDRAIDRLNHSPLVNKVGDAFTDLGRSKLVRRVGDAFSDFGQAVADGFNRLFLGDSDPPPKRARK